MNLFISTATSKIHVTLFEGNKIIKKLSHDGNNNHSVYLYKLLDEIDIDKVERVYLVNGPGSFTGLRVSMVFVKSLVMKQGVDVHLVNLLELLYYQNECQTYMDAKGKKYFTYDGSNFDIIHIDDLAVDAFISDEINIDKIIKNELLYKFDVSTDLNIFYGKSPI